MKIPIEMAPVLLGVFLLILGLLGLYAIKNWLNPWRIEYLLKSIEGHPSVLHSKEVRTLDAAILFTKRLLHVPDFKSALVLNTRTGKYKGFSVKNWNACFVTTRIGDLELSLVELTERISLPGKPVRNSEEPTDMGDFA